MAEPVLQDPYDDPGSQPSRAPGRDRLKAVEGVSPPSSGDDISAVPGRQELADKETGGDEPATGSRMKDQVGRGYTGTPSPDRSNKVKSLLKNRRLLLLGGIPSLLILMAVLFLSILLPTLKLPQLAFHIEEYRLVRLTRTFYKQASILTTEKIAVDAADGSADPLIKSSKTGARLASLRPQAVIDNMKATGILSFDTSKGLLGAEKITAVKIKVNGREQVIEAPKYQLGRPIANYKNRLRFATQINSSMHDALRGNNYLVRSNASKQLLGGFGISLQWWQNKGAKYLGLDQSKADQLALQETTEKVTTTPQEGSRVAGVDEASKQAKQAITDCEADAVCAKKMIQSGELPPEVTSKIDGIVGRLTGKDLFSGAVSFLNPIYAVGAPVCIIYDGSTQASKAFVNSQNIAATKTFLAVASAADQQKKGDVTAQAVGAFNRRVGDIADSVPEKIARGESVDTSAGVSPQAAKSGEFTIFDVLFSGNSGVANSIANNFCPIITDIKVGAGLVILNIAAGIFSGGSTSAAEESAGQVATKLIGQIASKIAQKFVTPEGRAALKNTGKKYAASTAKAGAATEGATYLARMLVLAEMGAFYNGTSKDNLANEADAGGVTYANEMQRQQQFGRPLTAAEVKTAQVADNNYLAEQKNRQSTFERYFALSNPDSLTAGLAMRVADLKLNNVASFFLNIPKVVGSIFLPLSHFLHPAVSAVSSSDVNYNVVQWGWSPDEETLIDSDPSFAPLENARILADSNQASAILDKYGKCFSVKNDGSGNPVPDPGSSIGSLLTNGSVDRDSNGNLQDSGDCSPINLGPGNSQFGDKMVFRWRLDQSYQNTLNELIGIQNPTADSSSGVTSGGSSSDATTPASGDTQQLAQQILANSNISYPYDAVSPNGSTKAVLEAIAQGQAAPVTCRDGSTNGVTSVNTNPNILQFVLEYGTQAKVGVNALTDKCHATGSNHYKGLAVDFECIGIPFDVVKADAIAAKYGIRRNSETCSAQSHWHYEISQ